MTKMYLQSFVTFMWNEVRETHLVFQKRRFQGFKSEILRVVGLLGENFIFLNSHEKTKISRSLKLSVYFNVVLLINFSEQFELCFYFKYSRSYKVVNLGDKTFETDFNYTDYLPDRHSRHFDKSCKLWTLGQMLYVCG